MLERDKAYSFYRAAIESKDVEAIRENYLELYGTNKDGSPDEFYQRVGMEASAEHLLQYAHVQMQRMQRRFVQKNLYTKRTFTDEGGNERKASMYDSRKAQSYLAGAVSKLKDEQKAQMYLQVAQALLQDSATKNKTDSRIAA